MIRIVTASTRRPIAMTIAGTQDDAGVCIGAAVAHWIDSTNTFQRINKENSRCSITASTTIIHFFVSRPFVLPPRAAVQRPLISTRLISICFEIAVQSLKLSRNGFQEWAVRVWGWQRQARRPPSDAAGREGASRRSCMPAIPWHRSFECR